MVFYFKDIISSLVSLIQNTHIRDSDSKSVYTTWHYREMITQLLFWFQFIFSRSVIKNCINATNYGLQGTRNLMLLCDGTQQSCKHPFTIIILINPAKNNSLRDFKEIISQANRAQNLSVTAFLTAQVAGVEIVKRN